MKLFDDKKQEGGAENVQQSMSKFAFVNEYSPWADTPAIRRACESWFEHIPPGNRADLKSRFRESDDSEHAGAFFELFLHEVFRRLDCQVEFQPNVSGQTPDFRVSQGGKSIYVEATVAGATSNPFHRSRNEQDVIDKLNTLSSPDFSIGVDMEGTLKNTLRKSYVTSKFRRLLDAHDPGKVRGLIAEGGMYAAPSEKIECGAWTLTGWLIPACEDRGASISGRPIVTEPYRAKFLDPISSVRDALAWKARKYRGLLDSPFVIAVNAQNPYYSPSECDVDVLHGNRRIQFGTGPDAESRYVHERNGFWLSKNSGEPAAVLIFKNADMLNMFQASVCLHVNPWDSAPGLPDALFRIPHCELSEDHLERREGEDVAQLLGVSLKQH